MVESDILHRKSNIASIPALNNGADWLVDVKAKADAFAKIIAFKNSLPDEIVDTPFLDGRHSVFGCLMFNGRVRVVSYPRYAKPVQ